jgi:hypothetical protein
MAALAGGTFSGATTFTGAVTFSSTVALNGAVTAAAGLQTNLLGVGTAPNTTRILMLSNASGTTPSTFTADDMVVGNSTLVGAGSGALFMRYDSTHDVAMIGALSPSVAWRNLNIGAATCMFQNASGVAKLTVPGNSDNDATLGSSGQYLWSSTTDATATPDVGLKRSAAGVVAVTDGSSGTGGITATASVTNGVGGTFVGLGTGAGVVGTGGATNGGGVQGYATANGVGVYGKGAGSGSAAGYFEVVSGSANALYADAIDGVAVVATSATAAAITATAAANYGLVVQGDTTSPAKAAFRIVPQDAQPSGPNAVGDLYVSTAGKLNICTVAGSPGTWVVVGTQS